MRRVVNPFLIPKRVGGEENSGKIVDCLNFFYGVLQGTLVFILNIVNRVWFLLKITFWKQNLLPSSGL